MLPDLAHLLEIQRVLGLLEDLEAFGVGLHHPVFDAVVNHLDEVARAIWADQAVAVFGRQRLDRRLDAGERLRRATGHDRVADLEAPDAAARAAVHELEAAGFGALGTSSGVFPLRVRAVDEQGAGLAEVHELTEVLIGDVAGWQHEPDVAWWLDLLDQILEGCRTDRAVADRILDGPRAAVECHDLVSTARQAVDHIAAHAAEANEAKLHMSGPPGCQGFRVSITQNLIQVFPRRDPLCIAARPALRIERPVRMRQHKDSMRWHPPAKCGLRGPRPTGQHSVRQTTAGEAVSAAATQARPSLRIERPVRLRQRKDSMRWHPPAKCGLRGSWPTGPCRES